jgi:monoterpene epsilon-lactone hydrolase
MASPQYKAFVEKMAANPAPPPAKDLAESRARIDAAMGNLPLAEGTSSVAVDANGVEAFWQTRDGATDDPALVYFHGGGYRLASALAYRAYCSNIVKHGSMSVLNVHYRLAPEHPFPAAIDDAVAAYQWLLDQGTPPARIVIAGDSAGGGLSAALLLALRDRGLPLPAGAALLSPWADLTNSADSYTRNAESDKLFSLTSATEATGLYLQGQDPTDPLASPVLGDWKGMPPLMVVCGDIEVLLDDARKITEVARAAGVDVELRVYEDMPHVWQLSYPAFPEAVEAFDQLRDFVARVAS